MMIGRTHDSSDPPTSRGRIQRRNTPHDGTEYPMDQDDEFDIRRDRNEKTTGTVPFVVCGSSPLHRGVVPSAPMEPTAPCSAPPTSRRATPMPMLTSPNVSQPRSSILRMPYSADHRVHGKYQYQYHSTPTQPFREMDSDEEEEDQEEPVISRFSYGAAKYLPTTSATPLRSMPVMSHQRSSRLSLESPMSQSSFRSTSTTDSRHVSLKKSRRSSTSTSLLFDDVINLETTSRLSSVYSGDSEFAAMDLESCLEGIEIGGGMRSQTTPPRQILFPHRAARQSAYVSFGVPVVAWSKGLAHAARIGRLATTTISNVASKTVEATQNVMYAYRPPLSPHARALEDLDYLQQAHKEKVGQLTDHEETEEHYDFVLLLKPQEVYRFWAQILDFRAEHLGGEFQSIMDHMLHEMASTDSTSSHASAEIEDEDDECVPLRHRHAPTPSTGMRRRTSKSPRNNDDSSSSFPMSPLSRVMMMASDSSFSSPSTRRSQHNATLVTTSKRSRYRQSMFERAIGFPATPMTGVVSEIKATPGNSVPMETPVRLKWGNRVQNSSVANILSPPVRSLTRGESSMPRARVNTIDKTESSILDDTENMDPNAKQGRVEDFPNPVIPRGIAARTNGMLPFLSALRRGFVVRRHRPGKDPVFCKIFSNDGGDTIRYHMVDPAEAMTAFKDQRVRHNKDLEHISSPTAAGRASIAEWASADEDAGFGNKFNVPDHVAASRYREQAAIKNMKNQILDVATKVANSGIIRAADLLWVHPAFHKDPRYPGLRRGDLGTASLRKSNAEYNARQSFSLVLDATQRLRQSQGKKDKTERTDEKCEKWRSGEGSETQFKVLNFEAASIGEFWLIFRGFKKLSLDVVVGRFAADRRAGIGGGNRRVEDQPIFELENVLHRDEFLEPVTVGCLERVVVQMRNLDQTYMHGAVAPNAVCPPSDYFLGFKSPGTQIWSRLRLAGLETTRVYSVDTRRVMIKIRCPEDRLTDVAEVLRLKMKTDHGTFAPFREDTAHLFQQLNDPRDVPALYQGGIAGLLRSRDRQNIIDFIIGSRIRDSGAELGPTTDVGRMVQARVPLHMHSKLESLYRPWVLFWKKDNWQCRKSLLSLPKHDEESGLKLQTDGQGTAEEPPNEKIPNFFIRLFVGAFYQPLDAIEEYFGEKVTFYFAWLQHCARHLLVLTLLGMIVTIVQLATNNPDHWLRPFFSITVMIWTFMVLLNWKRRSNLLAYSWGSIDYKDKETPRPEFHGEYVIDEITGEWVVKYPAWKRWIKYVISIPIILFFTGMAVLLILLVHYNRDLQMDNYVNQRINPSADPFKFEISFRNIGKPAELVKVDLTREIVSDPTFWVVMGALPALLGLCIPILNFILMKVSVILNDFENYRTESEYRTHLIIKVFGFRFVSQFGTLYYYAAISIDDEKTLENGLIRMGTSVMIYTTVAHWWSIFLQVYVFMFIRNIRRYLYRRKLHQELKKIELDEEEAIALASSDAEARQAQLISKRMLLDQAQDDVWIELMNPAHDSFPEYITAVLQFSFVACFSIVLPITPLFCLFNYLLSMRYDAYKLCRGRRRPLAQKTGGIGIWEHLLHIVVVISVLTNCWLIAFTNSFFRSIKDDIGEVGLFAIVVAWEHTMLLIKYVMQTRMSPLPKVVRDKLKREQYAREKERYRAMRTKDQGRRGKSEKNINATKSPGLNTVASYESIISDTGTVSA